MTAYLIGLMVVVGFLLVVGGLIIIGEAFPDAFMYGVLLLVAASLLTFIPWAIGHMILGG